MVQVKSKLQTFEDYLAQEAVFAEDDLVESSTFSDWTLTAADMLSV